MVLRPWQTRTHCCGHIVADTNVSPFARARNICCGHKFCVRDTKNVSDFVQKHFVSATKVSQFAQPKKHHGQQCVRNNVSSFTRAFISLFYQVIHYMTFVFHSYERINAGEKGKLRQLYLHYQRLHRKLYIISRLCK